MLFISPPFGNYLKFFPDTIPIKGSFTVLPRPGLIPQIFKTLRYSLERNGWINKIGLRNQGIDYAVENYQQGSVISIAVLEESDIDYYMNKIPMNFNIEINASCPNAAVKIPQKMKNLLNEQRDWCIVKLTPTLENERIDELYNLGFRQFHCCNTIPTEKGGLSGPSLVPYVEDKIKYIKNKYGDAIVIGGGGIRDIEVLKRYSDLGADHFAISSICFNPFLFMKFYYDYMMFMRENKFSNRTKKLQDP